MIPYILGGIAAYGLAYWAFKKLKGVSIKPNTLATNVSGVRRNGMTINLLPEEDWAIIQHEGVQYRVHPRAIGPLAIGQAFGLAKDNGWEVPTPELADAIWAAAPIKVLPNPMRTDGTLKTMMGADTIEKNKALIEEQVAGRGGLVAGDHKDIVQKNGKHGIYGWHVADSDAAEFTRRTGVPLHAPVTAGLGAKIIQQFPSPHGDDWGDYSQYLYPVKRV